MEDFIERLADGNGWRTGICLLDGEDENRACVKARIDAAVQRMSPQSRRRRFGAPVRRLLDVQLNELDGNDRLAWCAYDAAGTEDMRIGLARYDRS